MNQKDYDPDDIINAPGKWEPLTGKDAYKALKDAGFYQNGLRFSLAGLSFDEYLQKLRAEYPASRDARIQLLKVQRRGCLRWKKTLTDDIGAEYPNDLKNLDGLIQGLEAELRFYGCSPSEWDTLDHEAPREPATVQQQPPATLADADHVLERFFPGWDEVKQFLMEKNAIEAAGNTYRITEEVHEYEVLSFLYLTASAETQEARGKDRTSLYKTLEKYLKKADGTDLKKPGNNFKAPDKPNPLIWFRRYMDHKK